MGMSDGANILNPILIGGKDSLRSADSSGLTAHQYAKVTIKDALSDPENFSGCFCELVFS
jgi:hypothetical protein